MGKVLNIMIRSYLTFRGVFAFCFALLSLSLATLCADWFDAPPPPRPASRPVAVSPASPKLPATNPSSPFVIGGSQATIIKSIEQALASIQQHADQLAAAGDTAGYEQGKAALEKYRELLKRAKDTPLEPSLYPLDLGKKGCLFAVRSIKSPAGTPDKPFAVDLEVVSWMKVKIIGPRPDHFIDAELLDNFGKISLYKVVFHDLSDQLKAGTTVLLINMPFECIAEEQTDTGTVYHLKKI